MQYWKALDPTFVSWKHTIPSFMPAELKGVSHAMLCINSVPSLNDLELHAKKQGDNGRKKRLNSLEYILHLWEIFCARIYSCMESLPNTWSWWATIEFERCLILMSLTLTYIKCSYNSYCRYSIIGRDSVAVLCFVMKFGERRKFNINGAVCKLLHLSRIGWVCTCSTGSITNEARFEASCLWLEEFACYRCQVILINNNHHLAVCWFWVLCENSVR